MRLGEFDYSLDESNYEMRPTIAAGLWRTGKAKSPVVIACTHENWVTLVQAVGLSNAVVSA